VDRLRKVKAERDSKAVEAALDEVRGAANSTGNLLHPIRHALSVYATLGEVCDVLREVFGVYEPSESFR